MKEIEKSSLNRYPTNNVYTQSIDVLDVHLADLLILQTDRKHGVKKLLIIPSRSLIFQQK